MPIFKTFLLGSQIEINYEEKDKDKLTFLIEKFKKRLNEFPNNGKVNSKTIIFLASLKIEEKINELEKLLNKNDIDLKIIFEEKEKISKDLDNENQVNKELRNDLILSNDKIEALKKTESNEKIKNSKILDRITKLQKKLIFINKKINNIF